MKKINNQNIIKDGEIHLPLGYELSSQELDIIHEYKLSVKYKDDKGSLFIKEGNMLKAINNLKSPKKEIQEEDIDFIEKYNLPPLKSYTALTATENIFKGDIQIKFRGELDDLIAHCLFLQSLTDNEKVHLWLSSIRSILGNIMAASCMDFQLEPFEIDGLTSEEIHKYSHNPLKYIGHDHIVPSFEHGSECIRINTLRTKIRMAEVSAYTIYAKEENILRKDILYTLNRLSSAVYVLMLFILKK